MIGSGIQDNPRVFQGVATGKNTNDGEINARPGQPEPRAGEASVKTTGPRSSCLIGEFY